MKQYLKETLPLLLAMALILAFAVFDFFHANAACMPLEWVMRNGLTDEQISSILSKDASTTIRLNANMWRNVEFNTHRYNNVTNWLAVIGETNEFARLVVPLTATNEILTAENAALTRQVETLSAELSHLRDHEIVFLQETATTLRSLAAKFLEWPQSSTPSSRPSTSASKSSAANPSRQRAARATFRSQSNRTD